MKYRILFILLTFVLSAFETAKADDFVCKIKGEVINRPQSTTLLLEVQGNDNRIIEPISIRITDGKFEYDLKSSYQQMYTLTFKDERENGSWRSIQFINEPTDVHFTLYPTDEYQKNKVVGGKENEHFRYLHDGYQKERRDSLTNARLALQKSNGELTSEALALRNEIEACTDKTKRDSLIRVASHVDPFTPEYKALQDAAKDYYTEAEQWANNQLHQGGPSIANLCYLKEKTYHKIVYSKRTNDKNKNDQIVADLQKLFDTKYQTLYANHPVIAELNTLFAAYNIRIGKPFIDFTANDLLSGQSHTLSTLIKDKVALIDLWASWCGPCIKKGREAISIYRQYSNKGFTIVGVAREKKIDNMITALDREKFPWINLVELNDAHKIWLKYGIPTSGGSTFLVSKEGLIVAINPSPEQIIAEIERAAKP